MAVRIIDIARDVKLPVSTVGNILRNDSRYGKILREKVQRCARRLGYRPNIMARGLKGGKTHTVGILWSLKGPHASVDLVQNLAGKISHHGYVSQVVDSLFQMEIIQQALLDYIQRGVDAVVIQLRPGIGIDALLDSFRNFKAVVAVLSNHENQPVDQVVATRDQAIHDAVDHFIATGRKRPMILVPPNPRIEKIEPFIARLKERNALWTPEPVILHQSNPPSTDICDVAWDALEKHVAGDVPFDALLCGTDEAAVVAYQWLARRKMRIPHDVAVVGFNDSPFARYLNPPLASINRRDEDVAQAVEQLLFTRLDEPGQPPRRTDIAMQFLPRASAETAEHRHRL